MSTTKVRKERFEERHGVSAGKYAAQTAAFAKQISDHDRNKKYVLHPMKNKFLNYWDVVSTIALLWTATVTPFEASFLSPAFGPSAWTEVWYLMNRVLDLVFCIDMLLQFFIAYEELDDRGGKLWVDDHPRVIKHYVRTWFALDAATIFVPGGFDFYLASIPDAPAATASNSTGGEASASEDSAVTFAANMSILRVLRIIRLVKLVRLVRASRLWTRWKTKISLSYGAQTSLTCISMMLFGAHWYACIMALEASLHESPQDTWLGVRRYSFCDDLEPVTLNVGDGDTVGTTLQGSISSTGITDCDMMGVGSWYLAAFSWSVMIITGTGGTDFYPSSVSDTETLIVTILVILGALLWTRVLAKFCDVATNSDPGLTEFRQGLDGLNDFIRENNLPKEMGRRMREYLHQQQGAQLREHTARALPRLSTALQIEVVLHCHRHWLDRIWFLKDIDELCRVRLAMSMGSQVLAPGEVAPQGSLYVIVRGLVLFGGRVLNHGMAWGDDVLLTAHEYFLKALARAMTYTDVYTLSREKLMRVVSSFPGSYVKVRRATVLLVLRRHLIQAAKDEKVRLDALLKKPVDEGDFIDRVHEAASDQSRQAQRKSINMAVELQKLKQSGNIGNVGNIGGSRHGSASDGDEPGAGIVELQGSVKDLREDMRSLQATMEALVNSLKDVPALARDPGVLPAVQLAGDSLARNREESANRGGTPDSLRRAGSISPTQARQT